MTIAHIRDIDTVVYLSRRPDKGDTPDLARIVYKLRCDLARLGGCLRILRHLPGSFIEFGGCGLHGSLLFSGRPAPEDVGHIQADTLSSSSGSHALRARVARHKAHIHLQLSTTDVCDVTQTAAQRILKSVLGIFASAEPVAVYWSPDRSLMDRDMAAALAHVAPGRTRPDPVRDVIPGLPGSVAILPPLVPDRDIKVSPRRVRTTAVCEAVHPAEKGQSSPARFAAVRRFFTIMTMTVACLAATPTLVGQAAPFTLVAGQTSGPEQRCGWKRQRPVCAAIAPDIAARS